MDPLTMFSCPFRHDTTLQQHRLPSYGKRYEVEGRTNFLELFLELRNAEVQLLRNPLPRTPLNKGKKNRRGRCPLEPGRLRRQTFEEALRDGLEELLV
jgi:hypothetical protein